MATDLLSKIVDELDARLRELRPLLEEYEDLLGAASALEAAAEQESASAAGVDQASAPASTPAVSPPASVAPARRRGRPPAKRSSTGRSAVPSTTSESPLAESAPDEPARAASKPIPRRRSAAPKRAQRGAAAVAILAALEHGSHTVSELAVVTAMSGTIINSNLRRLQQAGTITRTKRVGDGKAAYALTATPA